MLLALLLIVTLLTIAGCQPHHRPDFMTRVGEDCAAGDQWACDLLDAQRYPKSTPPIGTPHSRRGALLLTA